MRVALAGAVLAGVLAGCAPSPVASPGPEARPTPRAGVRLVAVGDTGMGRTAEGVFAGMGRVEPDAALIVGDLSYVRRESEYCAMVTSRVAAPVAFVPGNHEGDDSSENGDDGDVDAYAACLPDRLGVTGTYPTDYYADLGAVRVVMISPAIGLDSGTRSYAEGTPERPWLTDAIRSAKASGRWVVVGMHKGCLTIGVYRCASGPALGDLLLEEGVDVVLAGHDHNYARSHQLTGAVDTPRVVDADGSFVAGRGTVLVTVGNGGHEPRTIEPLGELWASGSGSNSPGGIDSGFAQLDVTPARLAFREVSTRGPRAGAVIDEFAIVR